MIIRSNKPEAKTFLRWIIHEVQPSIRKTGAYAIPGMEQEGYMAGPGTRKAGNLYFPMAKLVKSTVKYLDGRAALKALHYFTGIPVDDLLEELEDKQRTARTSTAELYQAFADCSRNNGIIKVITKKRFGLILGTCFDRIKSGNVVYIGLRLKASDDTGAGA